MLLFLPVFKGGSIGTAAPLSAAAVDLSAPAVGSVFGMGSFAQPSCSGASSALRLTGSIRGTNFRCWDCCAEAEPAASLVSAVADAAAVAGAAVAVGMDSPSEASSSEASSTLLAVEPGLWRAKHRGSGYDIAYIILWEA